MKEWLLGEGADQPGALFGIGYDFGVCVGGGSICGTVLKYNAGHYAKRMNKISANYCSKVKRLLAKS